MIDTGHAVIVDVEATPARTYDEVAATRTMIERTEEALGLKPRRLTADTAYGTGKLLAWLLDAAYSGVGKIRTNRWYVPSHRVRLRRQTGCLYLSE